MSAEIYGRLIQIKDYACATYPKSFQTYIRDLESKTGQKLDSAAREAVKQRMINPSEQPLVAPAGDDLHCHEIRERARPSLS
jgi:hypothetical protein